MLLKTLGIGCVLLAGTSFGWTLSRDYELRIVQIKQFVRMVTLLKGEITYNNAGMREALGSVAERSEDVMGDFLQYTLEYFNRENCALKDAWYVGTDCFLKEQTRLQDTELRYIRELGTHLGVTDRETQIQTMMGCMDNLSLSLQELSADKIAKCKLYRTMGVMAGAFVAVILI